MQPHPRTAMLDLLESVRLAIKDNRGTLSSAQVMAVLAEVMADHAGVAFAQLSQQND